MPQYSREPDSEEPGKHLFPEPVRGQWLLGRYELIEQLGRGGMGVVWRALDRELDHEVALKFVPAEFAEDAAAREQLRQEAQAAIGLAHRNIVKLLHLHATEELFFLEMEYVPGRSLDEVVLRQGPVREAQVREWLLDVCAGLDEAHRQGVIHLDIKPANLILTKDGVVKIVDFGVARFFARVRATAASASFQGTPLYSSPEQLLGVECNGRSDLYSLGITAYEMLTGTPPFARGDVYTRQLQEEPRPIPEIAPNLWPVLERLLAKAPADRPVDVRALARELEESTSPEETEATIMFAELEGPESTLEPTEDARARQILR